MAEERDNDAFVKGSDDVGEMPDDFIPEDAWPICPNCLTPCDPHQSYCQNCCSYETINPLATYMPYERIRFEVGMYIKLWHKICDRDGVSIPLKLFYLFLIALQVPVILLVGLPMQVISQIRNAQLRIGATVVFFILLAALLLYSLIR